MDDGKKAVTNKKSFEKNWSRLFSYFTGFATILFGIFYLIDSKNTIFIGVSFVFLAIFLFILFRRLFISMREKWESMLIKQKNKLREQFKSTLDEVLSKDKDQITMADISSDVKSLIEKEGKIDKELAKIIGFSDFIYNKREELWKKYYNGEKIDIKVNNLLRSLVYPASSLYSVTSFVIGKDQVTGEAKAMLLMRSKDKTGREQEYDVLGQRMPMNSLPHNYVKFLICKYVYNYREKDIEFSEIFHSVDYHNNGQIDKFTTQVPCPFRIQEESNPQSDGSPFLLDYIYVLEVNKVGTNGVLQSDLKAEWVPLEDVIQICQNDASPQRYGKNPEDDKMYMKFESQKIYADKIAKAYLKQNEAKKEKAVV